MGITEVESVQLLERWGEISAAESFEDVALGLAALASQVLSVPLASLELKTGDRTCLVESRGGIHGVVCLAETGDHTPQSDSVLCTPVRLRGGEYGLIVLASHDSHRFSNEDHSAIVAMSEAVAPAIQLLTAAGEGRSVGEDAVVSLTTALRAKDPHTLAHSQRVSELVLGFSEFLMLSASDRERLRKAALLHDVGKIGIRGCILNKHEVLTEVEYEIVKQHPIIGEQIVSPLICLSDLCPIIRHHHERHDGTGYPDQLSGDGIPYLSRLVAIADYYDALTSDRPFRRAPCNGETARHILELRGTMFDPELVGKFVLFLQSWATERIPDNLPDIETSN